MILDTDLLFASRQHSCLYCQGRQNQGAVWMQCSVTTLPSSPVGITRTGRKGNIIVPFVLCS